MSIGMMLLLLNALYIEYRDKSIRQHLKNPLVYLPLSYFALYMLSGLYSDDTSWWLSRMILKAPLVAIPIGMLSILTIDASIFRRILGFYWWSILLGIIGMVVLYLSDMKMYNAIYLQGQVLPTPIMHSRYSIMVALAIYSGGYLFQVSKEKTYKIIYAIGTSIAFIFLHILAVRTGLVCFYISLLVVIVWYILRSRQIGKGLAMIGILLALMAASTQWIPSLKNKVSYTIYSLGKIKDGGNTANLSDSYRLASIRAGIDIGNSSPILGVGIGDLKTATAAYTQKHHPDLVHTSYTPQSQYILTYAGLGFVGVCFLLYFHMRSLYYARRSYMLLGSMAVLCTVLIVEQFLETQAGIAIYMLAYGVLMLKMIDTSGKKLH